MKLQSSLNKFGRHIAEPLDVTIQEQINLKTSRANKHCRGCEAETKNNTMESLILAQDER